MNASDSPISFAKLRARGAICADKTELLCKLVCNYENALLTRPDGFGKTRLIDTLARLFECGANDFFDGTFAKDKWDLPKCPVLRLDFSEFGSGYDGMVAGIKLRIRSFAQSLGLNSCEEGSNPDQCLQNLFYSLPDEQQFVLLIDNYDRQLISSVHDPELFDKIKKCLNNFFAMQKGASQIRFMLVTGITRFKDVSNFTASSDIDDISYSSAFAALAGYTREELRGCADQIRQAASKTFDVAPGEVTEPQLEKLLDLLEAQYGGFCFDLHGQNTVMRAASVNSFFDSLSKPGTQGFSSDRFDSKAKNSPLITDYLSVYGMRVNRKLLSEDVAVDYNAFMNPVSFEDIDPQVLLCQAGLLTLKTQLRMGWPVKAGIPNLEMKRAAEKLFSQKAQA